MVGTGVWSRWRRRPLDAIAGLLLVAVVLASTLLESGASVRLSSTLDENWRGAYDILVRPAKADLDAASTGGFVEANFVSVSGRGGISLDQLASIRGIDGVAVAAPIGLVGQIGYSAAAPILNIPDVVGGASVLTTTPTLYRISYALTLTDATGSKVVRSDQLRLVMQRHSAKLEEINFAADNVANASNSPEQGLSLAGPTLPAFTSSVIAVDPVAEQALLGDSGGFLTPLTDAPNARARTAKALGESAWLNSLPAQFGDAAARVTTAATDPMQQESPVVPLLVNGSPSAQLKLSVEFEKSDKPFTKLPTLVQDVLKDAAGAKYRPIGSSSLDLSGLLVPFATGSLNVAWPGQEPFDEDQRYSMAATVVTPALVGRPAYESRPAPTGKGGPSFRVLPQGLVAIDGSALAPSAGGGPTLAGVQSYRKPHTAASTADPLSTPLTVPVATFSLQDLDFGTSKVSYVPFGAYDPAATTLTAPAAGIAAPAGSPVVANPSGLDFISPLPGAITDLAGAQVLRGTAPIDAIRVRVVGIDRYTPATQQQVSQIATQISKLGLTAAIVAGASPQPVNIDVPGYRVSSDGAASDLGWVQQDWTTLGAAVTVDSALSGLSLLLLALALGVACVLLVACVVVGRADRVRESTVLITIGWRRKRIAWWHAAPQLVPVILVLLAMAASTVFARSVAVTVWVGIAALAAAVTAALTTAITSESARRPQSALRAGRSNVSSPAALARRQMLTAPAAPATRLAAIVAVSVGAAAAVAAIVVGRRNAGATRLAGLAMDRTVVVHLASAAVVVVAGLLLLGLARRIEGGTASTTAGALHRSGWARRDLLHLAVTKTIATCGVAFVLSLAAAVALGVVAGAVAITVLAAVAAWLLCLVVAVLSDYQEARHDR